LEAKQTQVENLIHEMKVNMSVAENAGVIVQSEQIVSAKHAEILNRLGELKAPIQSALAARNATANSVNAIKEQITYYNNIIALEGRMNQTLVDIRQKLEVKKHAEALIGRSGFQGSIFDEVLRDIESKTNRMITKLPNMNGIGFKITSTSVAKSGKTRKMITKQVFKGGKQIGMRNLSGGQQCALELCTDLAVRFVVMKRSGLKLGWISLDEAMYGLDSEPTIAMLEVLRSEVDGLILVIDHATEVKEGFEKIIKIEYNGKESYVTNA
jgi:DNA repair exonuclease SbcCD ATPase subunit